MPTILLRTGLPSTGVSSTPTPSSDRLRFGAFAAPQGGLFAMRHSQSLPSTGVPVAVAPAPPKTALMLPRATPPTPAMPPARVTTQPLARQAPSQAVPAPTAPSYPQTLLGA